MSIFEASKMHRDDGFSVCSLNTELFYHGLIEYFSTDKYLCSTEWLSCHGKFNGQIGLSCKKSNQMAFDPCCFTDV